MDAPPVNSTMTPPPEFTASLTTPRYGFRQCCVGELTLALDDEPATPEPATLAQVADRITEIITSGTHNQTKALVEALVAKVTITPDRLIPVFRIPQPHNPSGAATTQPAETARKERFAQ